MVINSRSWVISLDSGCAPCLGPGITEYLLHYRHLQRENLVSSLT